MGLRSATAALFKAYAVLLCWIGLSAAVVFFKARLILVLLDKAESDSHIFPGLLDLKFTG
jgi:hypothetical protein